MKKALTFKKLEDKTASQIRKGKTQLERLQKGR
jgi:hypothetical protein